MCYSPPGPSVYEIPRARILQWVAIQSPGNHPDPGLKPGPPVLQADSLPSEPPGNLVALRGMSGIQGLSSQGLY